MKNKSIYILLTISILSILINAKVVPGDDINSDEIIFSRESGFYKSEFELTLYSSVEDDSIIFYTIDGTDPTNSETSKKYTEPIPIKDRTNEPNIYSAYEEDENSSISISLGNNYKKPPFNVEKAMLIRAVRKNSNGFGSIIDKIYFITDKDLSQYEQYTVISLVSNPENLFGPEKGIYVTGQQYIDWKQSSDYDPVKSVWTTDYKCNYWGKGKEWEREASITIFENKELSLKQNVGIRIKGSTTRNVPHKSFNIYAKKKYGLSKFKTLTLFPNNYDRNGELIEEYKSFAIRGVYDEYRLNDRLAHTIIKDRKDHFHINMKSAILFLNGEYWGLYTIIESTSIESISTHYNIPKDGIVMLKQGQLEEGTQEDSDNYWGMISFHSNKDLTNENYYKEVQKVFDIDSILEHYVTGIYFGTTDWPNFNYGVWKYKGEQIEGNPYSDGKWRFFSFDFDCSMGREGTNYEGKEGYAYNNFYHVDKKPGGMNRIYTALLKNEQFRNKFINTFCDYVNDVCKSEKMETLLEEYRLFYSDILANSLTRWRGYTGGTKMQHFSSKRKNYETHRIEQLKTFFRERGYYVLEHVKAYFNLNSNLRELSIQKEGNGKIQINSIIPDINDRGIWQGKYFDRIPITITAIPSENTEFKGWTGNIQSNEKTITITLSEVNYLKATFTN